MLAKSSQSTTTPTWVQIKNGPAILVVVINTTHGQGTATAAGQVTRRLDRAATNRCWRLLRICRCGVDVRAETSGSVRRWRWSGGRSGWGRRRRRKESSCRRWSLCVLREREGGREGGGGMTVDCLACLPGALFFFPSFRGRSRHLAGALSGGGPREILI